MLQILEKKETLQSLIATALTSPLAEEWEPIKLDFHHAVQQQLKRNKCYYIFLQMKPGASKAIDVNTGFTTISFIQLVQKTPGNKQAINHIQAEYFLRSIKEDPLCVCPLLQLIGPYKYHIYMKKECVIRIQGCIGGNLL